MRIPYLRNDVRGSVISLWIMKNQVERIKDTLRHHSSYCPFFQEEQTTVTPSTSLSLSSINTYTRRKQPETYLEGVLECISSLTSLLLGCHALPEEASGQEESPSKVSLPHGYQVGAGCWLGPQSGLLAKGYNWNKFKEADSRSVVASLLFFKHLRHGVYQTYQEAIRDEP
uniref:uncharacterized protein LOC118554419 n=1 Tax=Halichoerus grypus TaxID=9711 RepID=UPI0016598F89|nr:uncharacterized protein LOC118554419 [Halichoerus grypus]